MSPITGKLSLLALAAVFAAQLATGPALAADPNTPASTLPPRVDAGPSVLPPPVREPRPTGLVIDNLPPPPPGPDGFAAQDEEIDRMVEILVGATDLRANGGACYGMITCCNSAWVQGCNADDFQDVCAIYDGVYQTQVFSDGSINYECHYDD